MMWLSTVCRAHREGVWEGHHAAVKLLLSFGDYAVSVGEDNRMLVRFRSEKAASSVGPTSNAPGRRAAQPGTNQRPSIVRCQVWQQGDYTGPVKEMDILSDFTPTAITHPDTYLNKVLIGSEEGRLQLWN
eukprot:378822-Prorocentrum_minimum.AAC.3